ncbi:endospore germination permease [Herbivorax sp. ANBcel31]|uniref:GerAB/ArcD/ProY family transporter n=1 Tax=Herbivorax sp. ANBcel31 TaxID=3069754 RepID=UPI0027AFC7B0|nr:endospore germination permease [Herbivorax sp. ANBcel31]MDQ2087281.1 endospore germination permease [Herbivorax sp. ANBcel31]
MLTEGKLGSSEVIWLLVITISVKVFFAGPLIIFRNTGTSAWYTMLISAIFATVGFTIIYMLLKKYPGKNILEIYEKVLGRFLGSVFSFSLILIMLFSASLRLREFGEVQKIYMFAKTPISFLLVFFVIVLIFLSFLGLESIARYSKLISFLIFTAFILIIILSTQLYQVHRLFPALGYGIDKTIYHGFIRMSEYGDIIIIAIIAKSLHGLAQIKKIGYLSILISALVISIAFLAFSMTFSYYIGQEIIGPMYVMTSLVRYGLFFERVESLFMFIWSLGSIVSVTLMFYMSLFIYCHVFRISDKKPLIVPFAIILFTLSMIPKGISSLVDIYLKYIRELGGIFYFALPLIVLIISAIFNKKEGDKVAQ